MLAARRWLEMRAMHRPVVVIAEDLQWADAIVARAPRASARRAAEGVPVAVLTFVRATEQRSRRRPATTSCGSRPLDDEAAHSSRARSRPTPPTSDAAVVVIARAGNPFFIEELARDLATG